MSVPVLQGGPYVFSGESGIEASITVKRKKVILALKNAIAGLGGVGTIWEVIASSNSTSVKNIGQADPDLWLVYTDIVSDTGPHSWVILENQTNGIQLCIDYPVHYLFTYWVNVYFSLGGTYSTNGTTSARPSCSDELSIWTNAFDLNTNSYDSYFVYAMASANHETLIAFHTGKHDKTAGNYFSKVLILGELDNTPTEWTSTIKRFYIDAPDINGSATPSQQSPRLGGITNKYKVYLETAEPYAGWMTCYEAVECYDQFSGNQGRVMCNDNNSHVTLGGYPANEIGLFCVDPTRGGSYGRIKDIFYGPMAHSTFDTYPADNSRQWLKVGCLVVPWNGTDPGSGTARDIGISGNFTTIEGGTGNVVRTVPRLVRTLD